jgi:hypothetical protein
MNSQATLSNSTNNDANDVPNDNPGVRIGACGTHPLTKKECRYCLSDDKTEKLIDPCHCEGTMKYVHQECLEDWIKNGNRHVKEIINPKNNMKIYLTICEICKYQMKYTKIYKNSIFQSIFKLMRTIFGNYKNCFILLFHSVITYFLIKRLKLFLHEFLSTFKKNFNIFNPSIWINFTHNLTVLTSILIAINDIYMFYSKLLMQKRKCLINFLPRSEEMNKY